MVLQQPTSANRGAGGAVHRSGGICASAIRAAGGLINCGIGDDAVYRQAGIYAGRILKGEKPARRSAGPTTLKLDVSMKTAQALGPSIKDPIYGRVRLSSDVSEIKLVAASTDPEFRGELDAAPTDELPIARFDKRAGERSLDLDLAPWSLAPYWAKDINAKGG